MLNLTDREWNGFLLTDIFVIKPGKRLTKSDMSSGTRPFIGATESNNGITNYVSNTNVSLDKCVLGVNYNGSVVETFYHPYECIFSDDVKRFRLKNREGNRFIFLFLKTTIVQQKSKYAYGYKFNEQRMNKQSILLPINDVDEPDWAFMEQYISEREEQLIEEYKQCILNRYVIYAGGGLPLDHTNWKEFVIGDLFRVAIGKSIDGNKVDLSAGKTPYITRKESNNGLDGFIDHDPQMLNTDFPVITIGNETAEPFVQVFPFYTGTKVNILSPKTRISAYALLFAAQSLKMHKAKYSYSFTINSTRLRKQVILLPVADDGEPDWGYMEQYIREREQQLIQDYMNYAGKNLQGGGVI